MPTISGQRSYRGDAGRLLLAPAGLASALGLPPVVTDNGSTAWPDASNTGPTGTLTTHSGNLTVPAGTIVSGLDITGAVTMQAGTTGARTRIENCRVRGIGEANWIFTAAAYCDVVNVEVGGGADGVTDNSATGLLTAGPSAYIEAVNIHHTSDGFRTDGGTHVKDSYVHDLMSTDGVHSDGSQSTQNGKGDIWYEHCTIVGGNNDCIFIQACDGFKVSDCQLLAWTVSATDQTSYAIGGGNANCLGPIEFTNNVMSFQGKNELGKFLLGPIQMGSWPSGTVMSGNVYTDGSPVSGAY